MGISVNDILNSDPQEMQRQRYMQQMQEASKVDPFSAIGFALGRGASNKLQGRDFFDSSDPALQRVSQTQAIYNNVMKDFDPEDPGKSMTELAKQLVSVGLTQPALLAAQEAAKYSTAKRTEQRATEAARQAAYRDNPYLMIEDALELPEDDPKREALLTQASRKINRENYDIAYKKAQINKAEKDPVPDPRVSNVYQTAEGAPLTESRGKFFTADGKLYSGPFRDRGNQFNMPLTGGAGPTAATPAVNPFQLELERRRQSETASRQQAAGSEEVTVGPTGEIETRIVKSAPATAAQKTQMTVKELQEYNRSGKIPSRLIGK